LRRNTRNGSFFSFFFFFFFFKAKGVYSPCVRLERFPLFSSPSTRPWNKRALFSPPAVPRPQEWSLPPPFPSCGGQLSCSPFSFSGSLDGRPFIPFFFSCGQARVAPIPLFFFYQFKRVTDVLSFLFSLPPPGRSSAYFLFFSCQVSGAFSFPSSFAFEPEGGWELASDFSPPPVWGGADLGSGVSFPLFSPPFCGYGLLIIASQLSLAPRRNLRALCVLP